jgi:ribonuclease HI
MTYSSFTDGGSRNNPGPAGIGGVLYDDAGKLIDDVSEYIGTATNNEAEYRALIAILNKALQHNVENIHCFLDSELLVKQLNGEYRVKNEKMKPLFAEVQALKSRFDSIDFTHVFREKNTEADKRVNAALDAAGF